MSYQDSGQPGSYPAGGNRPAQNARRATPGSVLSQNQFPGQGLASDFLGLDEGVEPAAPAQLLQPELGAAQAAVREAQPYREELAEEPGEAEPEQEPWDEGQDGYEGEGDDDGVHSSWVEEPGPARSRGMLPKVLVAMVLGMGGMTAVFVLQQEGVRPEQAAPLAPEMNTTPGFEERLLERPPAAAGGRELAPIGKGPGAGKGPAPVAAGTPAGSGGSAAETQGPARSQGPLAAAQAEPGELAPQPPEAPASPTAGADGPSAARGAATVASLIPTWQRVGETPPPGVARGERELSGAGSDAGPTPFVVVGDDTGSAGLDGFSAWDLLDDGSDLLALEAGPDESLDGSDGVSEDTAGFEAHPVALDGEVLERGELAHAAQAGEDFADLDVAGLDVAGLDFAGLDFAGLDVEGNEAAPGAQAEVPAETAAPAPHEAALLSGSEPGLQDTAALAGWTAGAVLAAALGPEGNAAPELVGAPEPFAAQGAVEPAVDGQVGLPVADAEDPPRDVVVGDEAVAVAAADLAAAAPRGAERIEAEPTGTAAAEAPPQPTGPAVFGPVLPAGVQVPVAVPGPDAGAQEPRTNVRLRSIDTAQVVQPDQRGPRQASTEELKGIWLQEDVPPMTAIGQAQKLLTPQVGQVRVILQGNEIFQGRLYAMGEGRVWINNEKFGQMGLEGVKVQKIVRIVGDDGTPLPGQNGSEEMGGLESVRIKIASGGVLTGRVIARDELRTTLVTDDGARLTFATDEIQFLDEAPSVSFKRAETKEVEPPPAGTKAPVGEVSAGKPR